MRTVAILSTLFAVIGARADTPVSAPPSDAQQILQLETEWAHALERQDRTAMERLVNDDFTFIEPDGSVVDREAYLRDRGHNAMDVTSLELADEHVHVYGNAALVTGLSVVNERSEGKRYRYQLRWKELWLKGPKGWRVRAGQATPVNRDWNAPFVVAEN
jgi:ketosteroid isomerase-like protein